ncbi:hypothetical protein [Rhodococcus qingshengii]|uniref:hypothetical protein n=1 Tax=Rhodococcus qingshengii TaxID=334542 RepID=UPI0015D4E267|nr:hypothetical protein [Rhodococcus qingshengii]
MNPVQHLWLTSGWWTDSGVTGISRDQLVEKWVAAATKPKPEKKVFLYEMRAWSGELGRREWIKNLFDARVATLAAVETKVPFDEPESWDEVSRLFGSYVDPLARASGEFRDVAHSRRPEGLPQRLASVVREMARKVPPIARGAMIVSQDGGVIDSQLSADQFIADPSARHEILTVVAMRGYIALLRDYVAALGGSGQELPEGITAEIIDAFESRIALLISEYGQPPPPPRELAAEEEAQVDRLLDETLKDNPDLLADHNANLVGEAWSRARKTLQGMVARGEDVTHAGILFTKLASVRQDYNRAEWRIVSREQSYEERVGLDIGKGGTDDRGSFGSHLSERRVELTQILAVARKALEDVPMEPCWERDFAIEALADGGARFESGDFASIRQFVLSAWRDDAPKNARSKTREQAAAAVEFILHSAVQSVAAREDLGDHAY